MKKCTPYPLSYNEYYTIKRVNTYMKPCKTQNWLIGCGHNLPITPIPEISECSSESSCETESCSSKSSESCSDGSGSYCSSKSSESCTNCDSSLHSDNSSNSSQSCTICDVDRCESDEDYSPCIIDIMAVNNYCF